jgi:hypothetical protein
MGFYDDATNHGADIPAYASAADIRDWLSLPSVSRVMTLLPTPDKSEVGRVEEGGRMLEPFGSAAILIPMPLDNLVAMHGCWELLMNPLTTHPAVSLRTLAESLSDDELNACLSHAHLTKMGASDYVALRYEVSYYWHWVLKHLDVPKKRKAAAAYAAYDRMLMGGAPLVGDPIEVKRKSYRQTFFPKGMPMDVAIHPVISAVEPIASDRLRVIPGYVLIPRSDLFSQRTLLREHLPLMGVSLENPAAFGRSLAEGVLAYSESSDSDQLMIAAERYVEYLSEVARIDAAIRTTKKSFEESLPRMKESRRLEVPDDASGEKGESARRKRSNPQTFKPRLQYVPPQLRKKPEPKVILPPKVSWEDVQGDLSVPTWDVINPDKNAINMPVHEVLIRGVGMEPGYGGVAMPGSGHHQHKDYEGVAAKDIPYVAPKMVRVTVPVFEFFQHCAARARWQVCNLGGFHFTFTPLSVEKDDPSDCFHVVAVQRVVRLFRTPAEQEVYYNPRIRRENKSEPICYVVPPDWALAIRQTWALGETIGRIGNIIPHVAVAPPVAVE